MAQEYWTLEGEGAHDGADLPAQADRVSAARRSSSSASPTRRRHARSSAPCWPPPAPPAARRARSRCWRSTASSAAATPPRPSPPPRCSRRPRASSASTRAAPCAWRSSCTKGMDIGEGSVGLITYMRTDSVSLAAEAVTRDPRGRRAAVRQGGSGRRAAHLQDQVEERPGSARGHPPDLGGDHARRRRGQDRGRPLQAVRAHLEARGRLADEPRRVRHRRGRHAGRRRRRRSATCCAPTARRW